MHIPFPALYGKVKKLTNDRGITKIHKRLKIAIFEGITNP
jgi:hypothetical protein